MVVSVLEGVTFESNSDRLTPASQDLLQDVVERLENASTDTVRILAHTDSQGAESYNQALSLRRARSVQDFLVSQGIEPGRLAAEGFGESRPVATNDTSRGRALNRRVELVWDSELCK